MKEILLVGGPLHGEIIAVDDGERNFFCMEDTVFRKKDLFKRPNQIPSCEDSPKSTRYSFWEDFIGITGTEIHLKAFVHEDFNDKNLTQIVLGLVLSTLITQRVG